MAISQELLDILACPKCKGDIYLNEAKDGLVCDNCKLCYEIREDIPIMLIDEAKSLEEQSFNLLGCQEAVKLGCHGIADIENLIASRPSSLHAFFETFR